MKLDSRKKMGRLSNNITFTNGHSIEYKGRKFTTQSLLQELDAREYWYKWEQSTVENYMFVPYVTGLYTDYQEEGHRWL